MQLNTTSSPKAARCDTRISQCRSAILALPGGWQPLSHVEFPPIPLLFKEAPCGDAGNFSSGYQDPIARLCQRSGAKAARLIEFLNAVRVPSVQTEVIVADTGSTGGLPEIQEAARARVSGARESGSFQPSRGLTQTTLLCCAFFLACLGGSGLRGQNFTAEGTVSYQSHVSTSGDGDLPPPDRRTFTITVKESQWLMRVEGGHDTINYTEIGHDAESLFVYRSHAQDRVQQRLGAPIPVPAGSGQIIPGAVPGHDETHAHYVWLGLASHRHFVKIDTGRLVTPPWLAADARRDRVPCDILLSK